MRILQANPSGRENATGFWPAVTLRQRARRRAGDKRDIPARYMQINDDLRRSAPCSRYARRPGVNYEGTDMLIIWGLRVVYRTLGRGVFFCRRCGGDREYRHRAGRRYITVFFIPLIPLTKTGEHVQCLTCKTRYVTEVLKLPTT